RLVAPVDARSVVQRVCLDVHVQPRDVVGRDDGLVCSGDLAYVLAGVGDLGAAAVGAEAAERRDHVAAHRAEAREIADVTPGGHRLGPVAIPGRRARALL